MNFLLQNSHRFCLLGDVTVFAVVVDVATVADVVVVVVGIDIDTGAVLVGGVIGCIISVWVTGSCC